MNYQSVSTPWYVHVVGHKALAVQWCTMSCDCHVMMTSFITLHRAVQLTDGIFKGRLNIGCHGHSHNFHGCMWAQHAIEIHIALVLCNTAQSQTAHTCLQPASSWRTHLGLGACFPWQNPMYVCIYTQWVHGHMTVTWPNKTGCQMLCNGWPHLPKWPLPHHLKLGCIVISA